MRILIISPYHGGSHKAWAVGFRRFSQHDIFLLTLPARFWKWRMHGGSITLARRFNKALVSKPGFQVDLILATSMTDLTTFQALTRHHTSNLPAALYMHENQLTYPLPENRTSGPMRRQAGERDLHYAFINVVSMISADRVFFNSQYHHDVFFDALPRFLNHFPDYNESNILPLLKHKSDVLPIGIDLERLNSSSILFERIEPPLVVWNQRWEYDKNPSGFFEALYTIDDEGIPFSLAVCGENFRQRPAEFENALGRLAPHIVHVGYADEETYKRLLWQSSVTYSTTHHEFFGIAILEAIHCQTFPILPNHFSYPEILPLQFHPYCLYDDQGDLIRRLRWALTHSGETRAIAASLSDFTNRYDWRNMAREYDRILDQLAQTVTRGRAHPAE